MKMVSLLKISLIIAMTPTLVFSIGEETPGIKEELTTQKPEELTIGARNSTKYLRVQKPFFYGRKFELAKDLKDRKGELYSPLITRPIRTLPSNNINSNQNSHKDAEILKHSHNEIFTDIQELFKEMTKEPSNETYFLEEAKEKKYQGGEETTKTSQVNSSGEMNSSISRSRQNSNRSLLVVLPYKADEDNVEDLFTKSPLMKVIENDETGSKTDTTLQSPITKEKEIILTTDSVITTRKKWRPFRYYRTTTEPSKSETTENNEDITTTYMNYKDAEMVTKKYENRILGLQNFTNHKFEPDFITPYPEYKRLKNKTKKDQEVMKQEHSELNSTTEFQFSAGEEFKPKLKRKGQRRKTTTEGPPKPEELSKVLEILPSDMKGLILHLGLNKENKDQRASENNFRLERLPQPTIDPMSYAVFKPLPLERQDENRNFVPSEMKDFLASFGLLPIGKRVQKSLKLDIPENKTKKVEDISDVNLDFLPDDLKSLLENMGLVKYQYKKEPTRIHIFKPSNYSIAHSEEDFIKLNAILSSIKTTVNESQSLTPEMQSNLIEKIRELNNLRYKKGTLSIINNEIKKISNNTNGDVKLKTTAKRATKLIDGPDPLTFIEENLQKNDVKRQDESTNTSYSSSSVSASSSVSSIADFSASSSSSFSSASSDTSTSVSEGVTENLREESPNIEALKESFGGGETASDDADIESSLPPKRPNGLYLLLDWNSFLEVGTEDDNRRVNLRFQPKIGDSRNFLPVSVP